MSQIDTVLLKVASRCNINCSYCYIYHLGDDGWVRMPKAMSVQTIEAVISALRDLAEAQGSGFAVVLHGGEPLLLGQAKLAFLLEGLHDRLPVGCTLSVQTNGTLLTDHFLDLCARTKTNIAVSLDGPRHIHDRHRTDHGGQGTFDRAIAGIRLLQTHRESTTLFSGVLTVIDPRTDPGEIYAFLKEVGVPSMDFLFRDGNHSRLPFGKASFESVEYGRWLSCLWDLYMADPNPVRVNILDDHTRLILGGRSGKEGKGTRLYGIVIIDTDGTIAKNDTLKSAYDGADRFDGNWSVHRDRLGEVVFTEEFQHYRHLQEPTSATCRACPHLSVCGGGMPLYRWGDDNGFDNPSVYCRDHQFVINHIRDYLPAHLSCTAQ